MHIYKCLHTYIYTMPTYMRIYTYTHTMRTYTYIHTYILTSHYVFTVAQPSEVAFRFKTLRLILFAPSCMSD